MIVPPWPALVLTAGFGSRLRPLTYVRAKPAVPVAGVPLACRVIDWLARRGIRDLVLNLHHLPETITREVGDGAARGVRVRYSLEAPAVLGSGGGPRKALPLLDAARFFIVNGDTLCDVDLAALARAHLASGARVTLALVPHPAPARYGGVLVDERGAVQGFTRPGDRRGLHFVGIQAVDACIFEGLPIDRPASTVGEIYPALIASCPGSVRAFRCEARFRDIGTPGGYLTASLDLAASGGLPDLPRGEDSRVAQTATLVRTAVWDRVRVGEHADLVECVLADDVEVPAGMRLRRHAVVAWDGRPPAEGEIVRDGLLMAPFELPQEEDVRSPE